jgi:hypothetical protein
LPDHGVRNLKIVHSVVEIIQEIKYMAGILRQEKRVSWIDGTLPWIGREFTYSLCLGSRYSRFISLVDLFTCDGLSEFVSRLDRQWIRSGNAERFHESLNLDIHVS